MRRYLLSLRILSVFALGIYSGSMFCIALCMAPFWLSLPPESYREHFLLLAPFLGDQMVPLMFSAIASTGLCAFFDSEARPKWIVSFLLVFLILPQYLVIQRPLNQALLSSLTLSELEIISARFSWILWHVIRTVMGLAAFVVSLTNIAYRRSQA